MRRTASARRSAWSGACVLACALGATGCQSALIGTSRDAGRGVVDASDGVDATLPPGIDAGPLPPGTDAGPPLPPGTDAGMPLPGADGGTPPPPPPPGEWRVVAYYTAWSMYARDFHVSEIDGAHLTHINYAFANISESGECVLGDSYADVDRFYDGDSWDTGALRGNLHQLQLLRARHPHVQILISIGGWTWSQRFSDLARTAEGRARFARSCADFMQRYELDGIDVDWEYPVGGGLYPGRPEDRENYTLLLAAIRSELEARGSATGRHYLLTIAAPAGPPLVANLDVPGIVRSVDWINVMTYDFYGAWSEVTGFNAPMRPVPGDPSAESVRTGFNVTACIDAYLATGIPPSALTLGVPFYGRTFAGVGSAGNGLFQRFSGPAAGSWENGIVDWRDLAANYLPTWTRHYSEVAEVPWLYDAGRQVFVSYDDPDSLRRKLRFARERGMSGVMAWDLSSDDDAHTLLRVLSE